MSGASETTFFFWEAALRVSVSICTQGDECRASASICTRNDDVYASEVHRMAGAGEGACG